MVDFNTMTDDQLIQMAVDKAKSEGKDINDIINPPPPSPLMAAVSNLKDVGKTTAGAIAAQPNDVVSVANETMLPFDKPIPAVRQGKDALKGMTSSNVLKSAVDLIPEKSDEIAMSVLPTGALEKAIVGTGRVANKAFGGIASNIAKATTEKGQIGVINRSREALETAYQGIKGKYGQGISNLMKLQKGPVDLTEAMYKIKGQLSNPDLTGQLSAALNKSPLAKRLLSQVKREGGGMTGKVLATPAEADKVLSDLEQYSKGKSYFLHPAREMHDDIQEAVVSQLPEIGGLKMSYKADMDKYRAAKKQLLSDNILENIRSGYTNPLIKQQISQLLPPEAIKDMGGYRSAANALKILKWVSGLTAGGAVVEKVATKMH